MEVKLDVFVYAPEELNITISEDRLVIKEKHEQKADNHVYVAREFVIQEVNEMITILYNPYAFGNVLFTYA